MTLKMVDARAAELLIREGARPIDIRDADEYAREHVRGAQLHPVSRMIVRAPCRIAHTK